MTDAEKTYLEKNKVTKDTIYETLTTTKRTYEQKVLDLAHLAENQLNVLKIPERTLHYFSTGAINDLFEGHAPYRPRYVMVDFEKFMKQGSKFLRIEPPKTFDEAIFALMSLYHHIPSITNFPVYLGNLDYLLDPFIKDMSDEEHASGAARQAQTVSSSQYQPSCTASLLLCRRASPAQTIPSP